MAGSFSGRTIAFEAVCGGSIPSPAATMPFFQDIPDFDVDEFIRWLGPRLVKTSGQDYAIAMHKEDPTDCSDRTEFFDWHSDGLYLPQPPRFVLLHCLDPGGGEVVTELASVDKVLNSLPLFGLRTLRRLRSHYIGHGGCFDHPILAGDNMLLASRGYISPLPGLSLDDIPSTRDIGEALAELYEELDAAAVPYEWAKGRTLIFEQRKFMHRRESRVIDRDRKLIRMWFS